MAEEQIKILAMPREAELSEEAMNMLTLKGVIVIRTDNPELVRLVTPTDSLEILPANEFMWAAVDALSATNGSNYTEPDANRLRQKFVKNLNEVATRKRRKLIGWSADQSTPPQE